MDMIGITAAMSISSTCVYCKMMTIALIQAPDYGSVDLLEGLGARLTLGGVLGTVFSTACQH